MRSSIELSAGLYGGFIRKDHIAAVLWAKNRETERWFLKCESVNGHDSFSHGDFETREEAVKEAERVRRDLGWTE